MSEGREEEKRKMGAAAGQRGSLMSPSSPVLLTQTDDEEADYGTVTAVFKSRAPQR